MREMIVDVFAGGGGASLGIQRALGVDVDLAINHDAELNDRRAIGIELKPSYYRQAVRNLADAGRAGEQRS